MSLNTTAVRIKVTLKDVKPEVMRRLVVPVTLRLDRLPRGNRDGSGASIRTARSIGDRAVG